MTGQRKGRGLVPFDDEQLVQMSQEIAALLVKHLPAGKAVTLSSETARMKSQTCVQVFGSSVKCRGIFSLNAVLRRPPPSSLNVKCFTPNG
ncbi:MAG: hypothetical protein WBM66_00910 [Thiothrix litoralis]